VLQLVDLWDVRNRRASDLSGGMQRRLELACALVHRPSLLFLDEPTAGIDPLLRRVVWDEIHRLRDRGVTAIVTTQYVTEAEECDLVALISEGRRVAFGTPAELRRSAFGGDLLEVTTASLFDTSKLELAGGVRRIEQTGPRDFRLVVDDAGAVMADIVQTITDAGAEVESVRESRPTFEEVFTTLVQRHRAELAAEAGEDEADGQAGGEQAGGEPPSTGEGAA
jgi:ABC-2 type transport system ATP-binding protein